ncbi:hypothetical protein HPB47_015693 [Ixodes persulcatus]|uniref:Uncharacterized protein n=1 Tax=Ixodes persulcatus TaxID=34615 RepID=A0AC60R0K8_IXOPE|nr:hypothetical protein HPB47_015693 [Ixodes persulcatus]
MRGASDQIVFGASLEPGVVSYAPSRRALRYEVPPSCTKVSLNPKKKKNKKKQEENTDLRTLATWWLRGGGCTPVHHSYQLQFTNMSPQVYRYVEGLYNSVYFIDENLRSALQYRPQPNDLFIVSYPKCGTTWLQYLVYNIFTEGVPPKDMEEFLARSVFLEYTGAQSVEKMCRPGSIKTHFPFSRHKYSKQAKYLYIARNPYDCCVSFYYHTKSFPAYFFENGTFSEFFDMFLQGKVDNGDYFNNLLSWYDHRHDPNVLFLTYECLKRDTESWVIKIADFIGKESAPPHCNGVCDMGDICGRHTSVIFSSGLIKVMANIEHYFGHLRAADRTNHNLYKIHNLELFSELSQRSLEVPPFIVMIALAETRIFNGRKGLPRLSEGPEYRLPRSMPFWLPGYHSKVQHDPPG